MKSQTHRRWPLTCSCRSCCQRSLDWWSDNLCPAPRNLLVVWWCLEVWKSLSKSQPHSDSRFPVDSVLKWPYVRGTAPWKRRGFVWIKRFLSSFTPTPDGPESWQKHGKKSGQLSWQHFHLINLNRLVRTSGSKWHHQSKMAPAISGIYCAMKQEVNRKQTLTCRHPCPYPSEQSGGERPVGGAGSALPPHRGGSERCSCWGNGCGPVAEWCYKTAADTDEGCAWNQLTEDSKRFLSGSPQQTQ